MKHNKRPVRGLDGTYKDNLSVCIDCLQAGKYKCEEEEECDCAAYYRCPKDHEWKQCTCHKGIHCSVCENSDYKECVECEVSNKAKS
jgi:hypothetical protein